MRLFAGFATGFNSVVKFKVKTAALPIALLLAAPLAGLKIAPPARADSSDASFVPHSRRAAIAGEVPPMAFPKGDARIRLLGISDNTSGRSPWWGPDGRLLSGPPAPAADVLLSYLAKHEDKAPARTFVFEADGDWGEEDLQANGAVLRVIGVIHGATPAADRTVFGVGVYLPSDQSRCTYRVGAATQPWTTVADYAVPSKDAAGVPDDAAGIGRYAVTFAPGKPNPDFPAPCFQVCYSAVTDHDVRIVAIDTYGRTVASDGELFGDNISGEGRHRRFAAFQNVERKDIKRLRLQVRHYQPVDFANISLQPASGSAAAPGANAATYTALMHSAGVHLAIGKSLRDKGQPGDGIPEFRLAVQCDPNNAEAQYELANSLARSRDKKVGNTTYAYAPPLEVQDEAIRHLQRAVALRPYEDMWLGDLGIWLSNRGRYAEAIPFFERALRVQLGQANVPGGVTVPSNYYANPAQDVADNRRSLADALLKTGRYREAVPYYKDAIEYNPKDDNSFFGYGNALNALGHHAEARAAWKKVIALDGAEFYLSKEARKQLGSE